MIPGKKYTPEDILLMAWKRKWWVIVPCVLFGVGSYLWARYQPSLYKSETLVIVVPPRVPQNVVRPTDTVRLPARLRSIQQDVLSRTRLEGIIRDFDLYPDRRTPSIEDAIDEMRRMIQISIVNAESFRISYIYNNARKTMQVTERLASMFIDASLRDREGLMDGTSQFLAGQLQEARERLVEHEKKLEAYNRAHAGELPTQLSGNLQAMNGMQMQLQALADSLNRDTDRRLGLARGLEALDQDAIAEASTLGDPSVPGPTIDPASKIRLSPTVVQLEQARKQLQELEVRLKPAHPDLGRAKRQVEELEAKAEAEAAAAELGGAPTTGVAPGTRAVSAPLENPNSPARRAQATRDQIESLDRQIAAKESEQSRLKEGIARLQERVDATPTRESELVDLTRDYGQLQANYRNLLAKNEEAKLSANLEERQVGEQFKVLDPATLPGTPVSPDRPRLVAIGTFLGLGLGVCLIALFEYRDTSLKTDNDVVSVLALPVLALVPVMRSVAEQRKQQRRKVLVSVTSVATVLLSAAAVIFVVWKLKP